MEQHQLPRDDRLRDIENQMIASFYLKAIATHMVDGVAAVFKACIPNIYRFDETIESENDPDQNPFSFLAATSSASDDTTLAEQIELGRIPPRWTNGGKGPGLGAKAVRLLRNNKDAFIVVENVQDPNSEGSESAQELGVKTTACLPLAFRGQILGVLYLHFKKPHTFTDNQMQAVKQLGVHAATAIGNALHIIRLAGHSYMEAYGEILIDELKNLQEPTAFEGRTAFQEVHRLLWEWAQEVRSPTGSYLAELMEDTITKLGRHLDMPDSFMEYYIEEYKKREGALQSISGYREHFVHPFLVFVLGFILLARLREEDAPFPALVGKKGGKEELKAWFATAMYHDIGYPVEKVERLIADFLDTSFNHDIPCQFDSNALLLAGENIWHIDALSALFGKKASPGNVASEKRHASRLFERWFHEKLLKDHDHGVLGALILLDNALKHEKRPWVRRAALAIALHTWQGTDPLCIDCGRLRADQFPLAFLLAFCDVAQEWGRNTLPQRAQQVKPGAVRLAADTKLTGVKVTRQRVNVQLQYAIARNTEVEDKQTLDDVFREVGTRFANTWEIEQGDADFQVKGDDRNSRSMGAFGPSRIEEAT